MSLLRSTVVAVSIGILSAGCYSVQPAAGVRPELGKVMVLELSDEGRVAMGPSIGQQVLNVTGKVVTADSSAYVLSLSEVKFLGSTTQVWRGEVVRFQTSHVSRVFEREFSPARTAILVAGVAAVAAAFLGPLNTAFSPDDDDSGPPPAEASIGRRTPGRGLPPLILRRFTPPRSF